MLQNKKLHSGGDKKFLLPGTSIPTWFEHYSSGEAISFWFRNKFPAISLCLPNKLLHVSLCPSLTIINANGNEIFHSLNVFYLPLVDHAVDISRTEGDHILILDIKRIIFEDVDEVLLENEWYHGQLSFKFRLQSVEKSNVEFGVHIFKQESSMENIQFTNPWERFINRVDTMVSLQQQNLALLKLHVEQDREWLSLRPPLPMKSLNDNVDCDPNSMSSTRISSSTSVQGLQETPYLTSIIQQSFEGYENVNKAKGKGTVACNSNDGEDNGRSPLLKLLPKTEVTSEKIHASRDESMNWDPMELEYQVAYPKHHP